MLYDNSGARHKKACKDKYEELKESLRTPNEEGKLNDNWLALEHMRKMENQLKEQEETIKEYKSFFTLLNKLLPNKFSTSSTLIRR